MRDQASAGVCNRMIKTSIRDSAEDSANGAYAPVSVQHERLAIVRHAETRFLGKAPLQLIKRILTLWWFDLS